jgi:hypothetical protein
VLLLFLVFCVVFFFSLRLVFLMLPVSLKCPFLIVPSVFSNVYIEYFLPLFLFMVCQYMRSFICVVSFLFMVCSSCSWNVLPIHGTLPIHCILFFFIVVIHIHCMSFLFMVVIPIHCISFLFIVCHSLYVIPIHCILFLFNVFHSYSLYVIPIHCILFLFMVVTHIHGSYSYSWYSFLFMVVIPIHGSHSYSWYVIPIHCMSFLFMVVIPIHGTYSYSW